MFPIQDITDLDLAFPAHVKHLMPDMKDIPPEFKKDSMGLKWCRIVRTWFYNGLPKDTSFYPKEGVEARKAVRHVQAILGSYEPRHEDKMAATAFLLSEWFDDVVGYEVVK
jgi:hypothetical protein